MEPIQLISRATKLNPQATRVLIAVPVLLASLALGLSFLQDWQTALIGGVIAIVAALVLMVVLAIPAGKLGTLGTLLAWFCVAFFIATLVSLFTSVMFDRPKPIVCLVRPLEPCQQALAEYAQRQKPLEDARAVNRSDFTVFPQFAGFRREQVQAVSAKLAQVGWRVQGEERTPNAAGVNEVRYRSDAERAAAEQLAADIQQAGLSEKVIRAKQVSIIRPNTLEVWISP